MDELRAIAIAILGTELIMRISVPAVITPGQAIVLVLGGGFVLTCFIRSRERAGSKPVIERAEKDTARPRRARCTASFE